MQNQRSRRTLPSLEDLERELMNDGYDIHPTSSEPDGLATEYTKNVGSRFTKHGEYQSLPPAKTTRAPRPPTKTSRATKQQVPAADTYSEDYLYDNTNNVMNNVVNEAPAKIIRAPVKRTSSASQSYKPIPTSRKPASLPPMAETPVDIPAGGEQGGAKHFVFFSHKKGIKSGGPMKIGSSNNVKETLCQLQEGRDTDLKTHIIIKCPNGDADKILTELRNRYVTAHIQRGWYKLSKEQISADANIITARGGYEIVSEAKAKLRD